MRGVRMRGVRKERFDCIIYLAVFYKIKSIYT